MKSKFTSALAGSLLAAALLALVATHETAPNTPGKPAQTKTERLAKSKSHPSPATDERAVAGEENMPFQIPTAEEETASLDMWKQRFEKLVAENGDVEHAIDALRVEIDAVFTPWVAEKIKPIAELPPGERYDQLDLIQQSVAEGAAAVFESLDLPGGRHVATVANALDMVLAEIQYAETAPDPESRLALLHLDREHQARLDKVVAVADEAQRALAETELEEWYSQGLAKVFPDDALTFESP